MNVPISQLAQAPKYRLVRSGPKSIPCTNRTTALDLPKPACSQFTFNSPMQLRDFIRDSLYDLQNGYFSNQKSPVVGYLRRPIDFPLLAGQTAYLAAVQRAYTELQTSWLTPVEIFSPHYGAAIGNYITQCHLADPLRQSSDPASARWHASAPSRMSSLPESEMAPLTVYEIGGGTGTLAKDLLGWLRQHHPTVYASCHYTCIEISPALAALQQQRVAHEGGHGDKFSVRRGDACDHSTWGPASQEQCFVLAMEVLDNMPHDR